MNIVSVLCFLYVAWWLGRERYPVRWLVGLGVMVVVAAMTHAWGESLGRELVRRWLG